MIKSIAFTAYPVKDMKRSRKFYEELLGLRPAQTFGEQWQEYDLGEGTFAIVQVNDQAPEIWRRPAASIAFEVDDLDANLEKLKAEGVEVVIEPFDGPACRAVVIADPDNNAVALHQAGASA